MNGQVWNFSLPRPSERYDRTFDPRAIYSDFPWQWFYPCNNAVTPDVVENYYVFNDDGECFPVYHVVPCNKCSLCRARKAKDWQARCLAESNTSDYPPLFVTLTYAPQFRPYIIKDDGTLSDAPSLLKEDYQKFLKRLRIRLDRAGLMHGKSLRYVICGEYGKNTHLPHYHMLIWNMPFISGDGENSSWEALSLLFRRAWKKGNVKIEKCYDSSGKYCLKYMRKGSNNPCGTNPCFFEASRRPGIGREWCDQKKEFYRANPQLVTLNIYNKFTDNPKFKYNTTRIPDYFASLWFPTLSRLMKQDVREKVERFVYLSRMLVYGAERFGVIGDSEFHCDREVDVSNKYFFLPIDYRGWKPDRLTRHVVDVWVDKMNWYQPKFELRTIWYNDHFAPEIDEANKLYDFLMSYNFNSDEILRLIDLHQEHSDYMASQAALIDFDVKDEVARIERENTRLFRAGRGDDAILLDEFDDDDLVDDIVDELPVKTKLPF